MVKKLLIAVVEDVIGEYILNISKENIKIAALRGKIELDNVQLDGDLIGSHVLGAVGLSGFGVLSCWARSFKVVVPLKNLEKEPTRFEIHGLHLVCIPLLPSNANRLYGAKSAVDPRCTLRTRAKRSALARFERNYFSGRIPGEGPPSRRVQRASAVAENALQRGSRRWRGSFNMEDEETLDSETIGDDMGSEANVDSVFGDQVDNIPAALRIPIVHDNWKTKLREKMLRNMECSIHDIHIRCEVSEQGLGFYQPGDDRRQKPRDGITAEQRAFTFGMTLDSCIVRTANDKWEVGSEKPKDDSSSSSFSVASGPKNKVAEINGMSIYWDDDPPLLISETKLLRSNSHGISPVKLQARVAAAMDAMRTNQDPGEAIRKSLSGMAVSSPMRAEVKASSETKRPHHYCLVSFSAKVQVNMSDRTLPGPISCIADFLPMKIDLYFRPHQYLQYHKLRSAMLLQQRFDTMLRQRPTEEPASCPVEWWKYAISCVTTRPNSRPWADVIRIVRNRPRYIELVTQKVLHSSEGNGFHGGLNETENLELLALEELLPIEALMSFHLLALRNVYELQMTRDPKMEEKTNWRRQPRDSPDILPSMPRFRRFRKALSGVGSSKSKTSEELLDDLEAELLESVALPDGQPSDSITRSSIREIIRLRLGKKVWHNTFHLNDASMTIHLLDPADSSLTLKLDLRTSGVVQTYGPFKHDLTFDVIQFEVVDCRHYHTSSSPSQFLADGKILSVGESHASLLFGSKASQDTSWPSSLRFPKIVSNGLSESFTSYGDGVERAPHSFVLPDHSDLPQGIVCRFGSSKDIGSLRLGISSHPATLVWNKASMDALSEYFASSSAELQTELMRQLQNVATPLARKAQLALLSPDAISLDVNMAAPKVWLPISSESSDGAVFLDAGRFRVVCTKKEQGTDTHWEVIGRDIQVLFVRLRKHLSRAGKNFDTCAFSITGMPDSEELPIIRPFHVHLEDHMLDNVSQSPSIKHAMAADSELIGSGPLRSTTVHVSSIRLTLVDAEVLARAIGKWYAEGIVRVKGLAKDRKSRTTTVKKASLSSEHSVKHADALKPLIMAAAAHSLTVTVEKIEMAIEGHSKSTIHTSDDQSVVSFASETTFISPTLGKRTYIVKFVDIAVSRTKSIDKSRTRLTIMDASILRVKENDSPFRTGDVVPQESQYLILVRGDRRSPSVPSEEDKSMFQPIPESPIFNRLKSEGVALVSPLEPLEVSPCDYSPSPGRPMPQAHDRSCILNASLFHNTMQHLDEVEIVIDSVVVRVTPTSLKDSAKGLRRFLELVELTTKEMERKVHEEGRIARRMELLEQNHDTWKSSAARSKSPVESDVGEKIPVELSDSSILFKVTLKESTLLAGRPIFRSGGGGQTGSAFAMKGEKSKSHAVIQALSKSLIMFQSIENPDGSGSKTLHMSLDNLSVSMNTDFEPVSVSEVPPAIGPTASDIRIVYATENLGCVVSQDVSLDFDTVKACLAPEDLVLLTTVSRYVFERLRSFGVQTLQAGNRGDNTLNQRTERGTATQQAKSSLIRYQKKGTGIATRVRLEMQLFSFILLKAYRPKIGTIPLFDLNIQVVKGNVEGCMSALSGECSALISANFFNTEISNWEYAVEPVQMVLSIDQMPNELTLKLTTQDNINLNLTSLLLKAVAEMDLSVIKRDSQDGENNDQPGEDTDQLVLALRTLKKRKAAESRSVKLVNESGLDFVVCPSDSRGKVAEQKVVNARAHVFLESYSGLGDLQKLTGISSQGAPTFSLYLAPSSSSTVGERLPIHNLPTAASSYPSISLHRLHPIASLDSSRIPTCSPIPSQFKDSSGRGSPDTNVSGISMANNSTFVYYNAEPVVEWCMQNQRLRSSIADVFSLGTGRDLLSSCMWSPDDEHNYDPEIWRDQCRDTKSSSDNWDNKEIESSDSRNSPMRPNMTTTSHLTHKGNWVRPYLKGDSPEWTDMTCILRMARERVMLPDNNWIWLDNWTADLSGLYGEETDADGWEYEADFETFNRTRRFYRRGDACRRRRWTRTRIVRPPKLDDPFRQLSIVWQTSRDENGNVTITLRSHVVLHNSTASLLTFFAYSPSWEGDEFLGEVRPGEKLHMPVQLASATNLRIGKRCRPVGDSTSIEDFAVSQRFVIVPTSYTSSSHVRTSIKLEDFPIETSPTDDSSSELHYLVNVECCKGIVDVFVEPVLKVINLLPCQLQVELGEVLHRSKSRRRESRRQVVGGMGERIIGREKLMILTGDEGKCTSLNPASKPHISLRVPGYQWSPWQRVVNRKAESFTWNPRVSEADCHLRSNKGDVDSVEEYKSIVRFERIGKAGDALVLIISVEVGHCPTIRVYAQYWILDKTGFGCRFCDGFTDILGTVPDCETSRRSRLLQEEANDPKIQKDMSIPGHQWPIGMSGMSLFFSHKDKFSMSIESGGVEEHFIKGKTKLRSKWISPMDVSIVIPKTVFSVDEHGGQRRFELAMSVMVCPGIFARTMLITLFPRYQIVNLLDRELVVAQDGCLKSATIIPSQSSIPFHRERQSLLPKVRLGAPSPFEIESEMYDECWTNGCIQLDKVGITSMRFPVEASLFAQPMVVQAEVRLATKEQSSAVVVVIWSTNETSNPLYLLRNLTSRTIICRQPLQEEVEDLKHPADSMISLESCGDGYSSGKRNLVHNGGFECGSNIGPIVRSFLGLDRIEEFVWILRKRKVTCFGFDDPEKPHILEWTCVNEADPHFDKHSKKAFVEVDAMGSASALSFSGGTEIRCHIIAEHSTKVIEFFESSRVDESSTRGVSFGFDQLRLSGKHLEAMVESDGIRDRSKSVRRREIEEDEEAAFSLRLDIPVVTISIIDNVTPMVPGREILLALFDHFVFEFSQNREGYHEFELTLMTLQVDNHVHQAVHPVLLFCPPPAEMEPLLHMSAVRRLQPHSSTFVFRYAAVRLLEIEILLDRRIAERMARFIHPIVRAREENSVDPTGWVNSVTHRMANEFAKPDRRAPRDIEQMIYSANSGRIYFEQLHLHPVRVSLTFTQEWMEWNPGIGGMFFQFIRGMASIANAPLTFTSFVVGHVFESPHALMRIVSTHYSSQLTKQIFSIIGSLAILGAPADFISNVGTGVRDFFYEPINGLVHGPAQFIEGLETGTSSLARGVFVGVVRGAANVTEVVNSNLAGLTADDNFIDERKAHQRLLTDAMSRGETNRTLQDSLYLAGASLARSVKSGAIGIVEQPAIYASRHGPVGFVKGVGKAIVGAVVKPVVGVGDAAVLVMNHVSEATSNKHVLPKIPKRLRRALPRLSSEKPNCVQLTPFDERAAKAQKIVTGGESVDDVYIGHVNIPGHLVIASDQCLWAIDRRTREPWCVRWEEISHFGMLDGTTMRITTFSQTGLKSYIFPCDDAVEFADLHHLLEMQLSKMGNGTGQVNELHRSLFNGGLEKLSQFNIPGIKKRQKNHIFGSCNKLRPRLARTIKDEIDVIEQCFGRVKVMGSESPTFFQKLDEEAWTLVHSWGQVFSGLSSRRCVAASIINGTGYPIQIKSHKLVEGGSPCYSIPTKEFDSEQGILYPGGAIIFFSWGVVPNLLQPGNVFVNIETNAFVSDLSVHKTGYAHAEAKPGYQVGFLEKSHDDSGWWAKYWLLVRKA